MYRLFFQRMRRSVTLTILLGLTVWAGSLQAASFRTVWDPEFNRGFSELAFSSPATDFIFWEGEAFITVPDWCVFSSTVVDFNSPPPGCIGNGTLDSFFLRFYRQSDDSTIVEGDGQPGTLLSRVSFDSESISDGIEVPLTGFIDAGLFDFSDVGLPTYAASLRFDLETEELAAGPFVRLEEIGCEFDCGVFVSQVTDFPPQSDWFRVPEPAPLSLLAAGMVAIGLSRRSRKA